jgi:nickel/cobalt transporter (NiCoT) family protein
VTLSILIFPALFTAAMSLMDTTDGILMLGAYGWAFVKPIRKLYYNMNITLISVIVALIIGGIEALSIVSDKLKLSGGIWDVLGNLSSNFAVVGVVIVLMFIVSWGISTVVYKLKRYDEIEVSIAPSSGEVATTHGE